MHVLVTGGGGYLGCILVPALLSKGHQVRLFDRFCFGREAISAFENTNPLEVVEGDIRRLQDHPALFEGIDAVAHLAGLANDPSCDLNPEMTLDVNVESTQELAAQAVQHGVRRFVFASSCSVYGQGVFEVLDELSPTNPVSAYARSKIAGEGIVFGMRSDDFEPVAARMATLFGWSPRMRFDLAVNLMTANAARRGSISVTGGGKQWRPFLHVEDAARAFVNFLEAPAELVSGEAFNVGEDENNLQIIRLAELVGQHFPDLSIKILPDDEDRRTYRVQFKKLRDRLGFRCENSIEYGVQEIRKKLESVELDPFDDQFYNVRRMKTLLGTPVAAGGEPVAPRFIPLARPSIGPEEERAVLETMRSGWVTSGPRIAPFEQAVAKVTGAGHAVAVTSCTAALHLCLVNLGVGPGDEVVMSPLTWPSVGNTVLELGAKIVFADVDPATLNVRPESVEDRLTERTRCIIPVHMAGQAANLDALYAISCRHGLPVVEDAAHALGGSYKGKPIGSHGDLACFSFYAIKNVTTFEGGAIVVRDEDTAARLRRIAAHGMTSTAWERYGRSAVPSPPEVVEPGYKYVMGNVAAAVGVEQLKKLPGFLHARRRIAGLYRMALRSVEEAAPLYVEDHDAHAWHLMIIRLRLDKLRNTRDEIAHALRQENIGTGFHFYGLHLHQYYREKLGFRPEDLPEATSASHDVLSLPLYPAMTDKNVNEVIEALKKVLLHARR